jgi:hypothetical protein
VARRGYSLVAPPIDHVVWNSAHNGR